MQNPKISCQSDIQTHLTISVSVEISMENRLFWLFGSLFVSVLIVEITVLFAALLDVG